MEEDFPEELKPLNPGGDPLVYRQFRSKRPREDDSTNTEEESSSILPVIASSSKEWIVARLNAKTFSVREMANRYGIPYKTVEGWKWTLQKSGRLDNPAHRPPSVNANSVEVANFVTTRVAEIKESGERLSPNGFRKVLNDAAVMTWRERGLRESVIESRRAQLEEVRHGFCSETVDEYMHQFGLKEMKVQTITDARYKAMVCPRVSYVWVIMLMAFAAHLAPQHKWNMDCTTFQISFTDDNKCKIVVFEDPIEMEYINNHRNPNLPSAYKYITKAPSNETCLFIKWAHMCNAEGDISPLVFVVAVDAMDPEDFFVATVPGLLANGGAGDGYIIFCHSRCGNPEVWKWYLLTVALATIKRFREHYSKIEVRYIVIIILENLLFVLIVLCRNHS